MNKIFLLVLISGFSGGSVYPLIKIANKYNVPMCAYIFWETLFISSLIFIVSKILKQKIELKKSEIKYYLFCAITNIIIPQSLFFIIAPNLPASLISLVIVLTPIFIYLQMLLFSKNNLPIKKIAGLIIGFLGTLLLFVPNLITTGSEIRYFWILFSFLLPLDYSINRILVTKLRPANASSYTLAFGFFALVSMLTCIGMFLSDTIYIPFINFNYGDLAIVCHAILMTIFYLIFFILAKSGALENALSFYVAPLVGIFWGILFFNERIGILFILSTFLIFSSLYLITSNKSS